MGFEYPEPECYCYIRSAVDFVSMEVEWFADNDLNTVSTCFAAPVAAVDDGELEVMIDIEDIQRLEPGANKRLMGLQMCLGMAGRSH
jgi:hypothetical protein